MQTLKFWNHQGPWKSHNSVSSFHRFCNVVSWSAASASPGNLLGTQIPRPHSRPTESEILRWGPAICVLESLPFLTGAAQWVGHCPTNWKVICSIPVRAQVRVAGLVTDWGCERGSQLMFLCTSIFLSLFFSLPSPLSKNKHIKPLKKF